jgi:hypothetical protein
MLAVSVLSSSSSGEPTDSPPILISSGVYLRHAAKDTVLFRDFSSILFKVQFGFYHAEDHLQDMLLTSCRAHTGAIRSSCRIALPLIRNLRTTNEKLEFLHTALTNQLPVHPRKPPKLAQQSEPDPPFNRPSHPSDFRPYSYWYPNSTSTTTAGPPAERTNNKLAPLSANTPTTTTTTSSPQWVSSEEQSEDSSPLPPSTRRTTQSTIFDSSEEVNFRGRRETSFNRKPKRQLFLGGMVVGYAAFKLFSYFDKTSVDQASMYESLTANMDVNSHHIIQVADSVNLLQNRTYTAIHDTISLFNKRVASFQNESFHLFEELQHGALRQLLRIAVLPGADSNNRIVSVLANFIGLYKRKITIFCHLTAYS